MSDSFEKVLRNGNIRWKKCCKTGKVSLNHDIASKMLRSGNSIQKV